MKRIILRRGKASLLCSIKTVYNTSSFVEVFHMYLEHTVTDAVVVITIHALERDQFIVQIIVVCVAFMRVNKVEYTYHPLDRSPSNACVFNFIRSRIA